MRSPKVAVIVFAIVVALYGIDKFLAAQERTEMHRVAEDHFSAGQKLMNSGRPKLAVDAFGRAHSIERVNRQYALALVSAEVADGDLDPAVALLGEALERNSNDGMANLLMARAMAARGDIGQAGSFYHRAIYGEWPAAAWSVPLEKIRLELCLLLAKGGRDRQLLSELLLLEAEPGLDRATQARIAGLFLQAGSASHAAEIYRRLNRGESRDAQAYAGLGRAEELGGNYRAAELAFEHAVRLKADDASLPRELLMVAKLSALDPTSRRLSSAEKFRRSGEILSLVEDNVRECLSKDLADEAERMKTQKPAAAPTNEMAEARLDLAQKLWGAAASGCKRPGDDDPLPLLMKKLGLAG